MNASASPLLAWSEQLATGHAGIDATHQEFIALANALFMSTDEQMLDRLKAFQSHAQRHFAEEDALMKGTAYPSAGCHVDEHAAVLASIAEVVELVDHGRHDIGRDLTDHLLRWFPEHTDHMDQSLVRWLVKHATGGVPVAFHRTRRAPPVGGASA